MTEAPSDAIGLSDRLRDVEAAERRVAGDCDCRPEDTANWQYADTCREAATALDALQARVKELEAKAAALFWSIPDDIAAQIKCGDLQKRAAELLDAESRATSAEQERDEAYERLKPFAAYTVKAIMLSEQFDYCVHVCCSADEQPQFKHFSAARDLVRRLAAGAEKEKRE